MCSIIIPHFHEQRAERGSHFMLITRDMANKFPNKLLLCARVCVRERKFSAKKNESLRARVYNKAHTHSIAERAATGSVIIFIKNETRGRLKA